MADAALLERVEKLYEEKKFHECYDLLKPSDGNYGNLSAEALVWLCRSMRGMSKYRYTNLILNSSRRRPA